MDDLYKKRVQIGELMEYAVPADMLEEAREMLEMYRDDRIALEVLHEFYSYLPEGLEDWIRELRRLQRRQGVFLLAAVSSRNAYLYLVSSEGIEFQGTFSEGILDTELLDYFGLDESERPDSNGAKVEDYPVYESLALDEDICPACHCATGEMHELGCPVEVCPWCNGQLIHCDCRFTQLGVESLSEEADLLRLEELLEQQGRIPYSPQQRPYFPLSEEDE